MEEGAGSLVPQSFIAQRQTSVDNPIEKVQHRRLHVVSVQNLQSQFRFGAWEQAERLLHGTLPPPVFWKISGATYCNAILRRNFALLPPIFRGKETGRNDFITQYLISETNKNL